MVWRAGREQNCQPLPILDDSVAVDELRGLLLMDFLVHMARRARHCSGKCESARIARDGRESEVGVLARHIRFQISDSTRVNTGGGYGTTWHLSSTVGLARETPFVDCVSQLDLSHRKPWSYFISALTIR